jgi:eukaryotic-like serine/threonine-protein kinase
MNELAGQCLGGYELEEEIGRGSMGMVYRGRQIALGREVAIKVLSRALARDASYVARFIREAQIIAGLNHPHIVQIFDAGQQNGLLYFVMEYVQGPTIASLLHLDGAIPPYLAAEYTAQIAEALDFAYRERHVIHRDIKPENLMLDRWGKIKVMDFGLARAIGLQKITVAKALVGSIYYASPEQVWGQTLDNRSDIYALGVVLYEMVSGQRPFVGRSLPELTQAITSGPVQPPGTFTPELSAELEQIILVAMARNRDERYEQAILMAQALRALNLQAPTHHFLPGTPGAASESPLKTNEGKTSRERVVLQLPKRPQIQRPLSQDLTHSPPGKPVASEPVPTAPLATASAEPPLINAQEINIEGPTGPLEPFPAQREIEQLEQKASELAKRQPFWRKLFKSSPQ